MRPRPLACVLLILVLPLLTLAPRADACVLAARLAAVAPFLTEEQVMALAHDHHQRETIPYELAGPAPCVGGMADIFPCRNVDLLAHLAPADLGGGSGNDLWGWTDPMTQKEYALMGLTNGTAFVDVSDPANPVYLGRLPSHNNETSAWRDVAIFADHAFIVADFAGNHGLQVFDLTRLRPISEPPEPPEPPEPVEFTADARYAGFASAHNVAMNEDSGFAYVVGSNTCAGGLHIVDVNNPLEPSQAGCFSGDGYTHDVQCVIYNGPDEEHQGKEICVASNEDTITIVDVTDKSVPIMLSRTGYPNSGYIHQGWLTEDHRHFVHDDELDEIMFGHNTRSYTWDVSDLDLPVLNGFFEADGPSIDHNQYILGSYNFQANYTRGLRILRLDDPATSAMTEVGFIDTVPENDSVGFSGAWSTYPFFDSGIVLISDIGRGLFIVRPHVTQGLLFEDSFESGDASRWSDEAP